MPELEQLSGRKLKAGMVPIRLGLGLKIIRRMISAELKTRVEEGRTLGPSGPLPASQLDVIVPSKKNGLSTISFEGYVLIFR